MKKLETGAIGSGIVVLAIVIYGIKAERGWKYWVLAMLFLPWTGFAVGTAFGQEDDINSITETTSP
jgi:type IV secretory pathway VirB2 component (pilin)